MAPFRPHPRSIDSLPTTWRRARALSDGSTVQWRTDLLMHRSADTELTKANESLLGGKRGNGLDVNWFLVHCSAQPRNCNALATTPQIWRSCPRTVKHSIRVPSGVLSAHQPQPRRPRHPENPENPTGQCGCAFSDWVTWPTPRALPPATWLKSWSQSQGSQLVWTVFLRMGSGHCGEAIDKDAPLGLALRCPSPRARDLGRLVATLVLAVALCVVRPLQE